MNAQGSAEHLPFSEEELFRAIRLALPEDQAREMARHWAAIPEMIAEGEAIGWGLAEGTYIFLSLLGGETAKRVEEEYLVGLSDERLAEFNRQREEIRRGLEEDGKL
jgi:hypothetical protein